MTADGHCAGSPGQLRRSRHSSTSCEGAFACNIIHSPLHDRRPPSICVRHSFEGLGKHISAPGGLNGFTELMVTTYRLPSFPGLNKANTVPHWQRLHQAHDGVRQWDKVCRETTTIFGRRKRRRPGARRLEQHWNNPTRFCKFGESHCNTRTDAGFQGPRAKYMLYPYYALLISCTAGE
jgi:hypothetical protein